MAGLKSQFSGKDDQELLWDDKGKGSLGDQFDEKFPLKSSPQFTQPNGKEANKDDDDSKKEKKPPSIGFFELFQFADSVDKVLMFFGSLFAVLSGPAYPVMFMTFGKCIDFLTDVGRMQNFLDTIPEYLHENGYHLDDFNSDTTKLNKAMCEDIAMFYNGTKNCTVTLDDTVMDRLGFLCIVFSIIAGCFQIFAYIEVTCWMIAAERQTNRIRRSCLSNILSQDIGWFDTNDIAELNTRLSEDISKIQDGIGDKVGTWFKVITAVLCILGICFYHEWRLTLVLIGCGPIMSGTAAATSKLVAKASTLESQAYGKAGAIAEEVFGAMRTVVAFGGQEKEAQRYFNHLGEARRFGVQKGLTNGILIGTSWMTSFLIMGMGFWYGGKLHRDHPDDIDISNILIVFYGMMYGSYELGTIAPCIQAQATARASAHVIFQLIKQKSKIDSWSESGQKPSTIAGLLTFKNVHFSYPSRSNVKILDNLSIEAHPGQTVALVGSSGCGKSTIVQLLLRFYDPLQGQVMLDGRDIKDLNIKWLRKNIGLVSQEPVLFCDTIEQNIRYGKDDVTFDEIVAASKNANAYDFINQLPDKFNTMVGERGAQLSGGQKQRIAIARALVRDPKILLLDEATSALDTESEAIVQDALDKARMGRTTLVIAHRLSTIKTADVIIGMHKGCVKEVGTHNDLMAKKGIYYQLVINQQTHVEEKGEKKAQKNEESQASKELANRQLSRVKSVEEEAETDEDLPDAPFFQLLKMNAPEWFYILWGCVGSCASGAMFPVYSLILGKVMKVFTWSDNDKMKDEMDKYSLIFVGFALALFITFFIQNYMFSLSGEALTLRIRDLTFRSMLRQDISWFDNASNGVGALTTRLSTEASQVQGVTGFQIGGILMSLSSVGFGVGIAMYYGWQMTLVMVAFLPVVAIGGFMQVRLMADQNTKNKHALEDAGKVTVETLENIRTVAALSQERSFFTKYTESIGVPYQANKKNAHFVGLSFGFAHSMMFLSYGVAFIFGGYMVEESEMEFQDVFVVFGSVVFGGLGIGGLSAMYPDVGKAQTSAKRILHIINSKPTIDHTDTSGKALPNDYSATVAFKDVTFHYVTRASVPVLQGLNVSVTPGQTLALVGSSGCGKSTTIQLMERFYDAITGSVCLDNHNIKSLNVSWFRAQLGLVSQEPILFNASIRDNIAYGDNSRDVHINEIIEAAKKANVHNFISSLPNGYETNAGTKGTQLSGGQKQRIAIARALVRNPKILLLDEATSALDTESEKIVQQALDKAREGRTCIVIAHRLSTIQNSDKICVISQGKVTEQGTHNELVAMDGFYHTLVQASQRKS